MPPPLPEATLDLLLRVDRLLVVADEVRELRDRLIESASRTLPPIPVIPIDRKAVTDAAC